MRGTPGPSRHGSLGIGCQPQQGVANTIALTIDACGFNNGKRGAAIFSAGGYIRDLTRKAVKGEFSISPMLMALI